VQIEHLLQFATQSDRWHKYSPLYVAKEGISAIWEDFRSGRRRLGSTAFKDETIYPT